MHWGGDIQQQNSLFSKQSSIYQKRTTIPDKPAASASCSTGTPALLPSMPFAASHASCYKPHTGAGTTGPAAILHSTGHPFLVATSLPTWQSTKYYLVILVNWLETCSHTWVSLVRCAGLAFGAGPLEAHVILIQLLQPHFEPVQVDQHLQCFHGHCPVTWPHSQRLANA